MTFSGSLMEKNGYLESCHQLNPNNGIKQLENQHNPCLLDVYIYSLICLYRTLLSTLPPFTVFQTISGTLHCIRIMNTELLSPELDLDFQKKDGNNDQIMKSLEQEIECPRCSDIMILSSDFDSLLYFCQECQLSLVMKQFNLLTLPDLS